MRFLLAAAFSLLASSVFAQGTDTLSCSGEFTYPEGQAPASFTLPLDCTVTNTPPVDNPPSAASLTGSCDEGGACAGDIGATDDSGSVAVTWGSTGLTGFQGNPDGSWSASPVDGDGQAVYGITGTLDDGVNPAVGFTLSITVADTITVPDPEPGLNIGVAADLPAGQWVEFGLPWSNLETTGALERNRDNCNRQLDAILGAWNGLAWDGPYLWNFAGGGHGDGCFNGVLRYDMQAGTPEVVLPHAPLNMPLLWTYNAGTDGYNEPYAVDPANAWPACVGLDPNCDSLTKADRLANGPAYPDASFLTSEGLGTEVYGAFVRPRSSHYYNNLLRDGDWLYLLVGQTYGGTKNDAQVWRYNVVTQAVERLPNRHNGADQIGGYNANVVKHPDGRILMFSGARVCNADFAAGIYNCANHSINVTNAATLAWDEGRGGFWAIDTQLDRLVFLEEVGGVWTSTTAVSDPILKKSVIGSAGICLVPTDTGANPVIWGDDARLLRWDGTALTEVTGQVGQPATAPGTVLNKWRWNEDLGVCLLAQSWGEGIHAWRPDFSNWQEAGGGDPDPDPDPEPGTWPTFAGHEVRPVAYPLAAHDEPATFQPEAPDINAVCPGPWTELHYTTDAELAQSNFQTQVDSARVYLHAKPDGSAYTEKVAFNNTRCVDLVGVPDPVTGALPFINRSNNGIEIPKTGDVAIIRGIEIEGGGISWGCHVPTSSCALALVLQGNVIRSGHLFGDADPSYQQTYLEMVGNEIGPNTDWHVLYIERSIGLLVARGNIIYGSDSFDKHALKNLANRSIIEGNVLSNVGFDGQVLAQKSNGDDIIGLAPLDLYVCTDSVVRNNTIIFRTTNVTRTFALYRNRNAWNACNKGERQADGSRTLWQPESPDFFDAAKWALIDTALQAGVASYEAHLAQDWLFTHLVAGNTYIAFNAWTNSEGVAVDDTRVVNVDSIRPLADNAQEATFKQEYIRLRDLCAVHPAYADREACWLSLANDEALYVFNHINPNLRPNLVNNASAPNGQPILAPDEYRERGTVFVGTDQTFITCNGDGTSCAVTGPRAASFAPLAWDAVQVAHPPRVLPYTAP